MRGRYLIRKNNANLKIYHTYYAYYMNVCHIHITNAPISQSHYFLWFQKLSYIQSTNWASKIRNEKINSQSDKNFVSPSRYIAYSSVYQRTKAMNSYDFSVCHTRIYTYSNFSSRNKTSRQSSCGWRPFHSDEKSRFSTHRGIYNKNKKITACATFALHLESQRSLRNITSRRKAK